MWNEALNQAGVEASSALRRAENVYYPPAIRALGPLGSMAEATPKGPDLSKDVPAKAPPPSSNSHSKEAEQVRAAKKEKGTTKGVVPEVTKPPVAPKDPSKVSESLKIVLATLSIPTKEDPKDKGPAFTTATTAKPTKAIAKDNPPLKIK